MTSETRMIRKTSETSKTIDTSETIETSETREKSYTNQVRQERKKNTLMMKKFGVKYSLGYTNIMYK